jgi:hypothetical protein
LGPQPPVELDRPPGSRVGWRLAVVALAGVLVGLVALSSVNSGTSPVHEPPPSTSAAPVAVATVAGSRPVPSPTSRPGPATSSPAPATPVGSPTPAGDQNLGLADEVTADGSRYVDGIPTSIDGSHVDRLGSIRNLPVGSSVLVGGWYQPPGCGPLLATLWCAPGVLADLPGGSSRIPELILDQGLGGAAGARIISATLDLDATCMLDARPACPPELDVDRVLWSGDDATLTAPIDPFSLLSELTKRFPYADFAPLGGDSRCAAVLPFQAYTAVPIAGLVPRTELPLPATVVALFPSTAARRRAESSVRNAYSCPAIAMGRVSGSGPTWIIKSNVMVLSYGQQPASPVAEALAAAAAAPKQQRRRSSR